MQNQTTYYWFGTYKNYTDICEIKNYIERRIKYLNKQFDDQSTTRNLYEIIIEISINKSLQRLIEYGAFNRKKMKIYVKKYNEYDHTDFSKFVNIEIDRRNTFVLELLNKYIIDDIGKIIVDY